MGVALPLAVIGWGANQRCPPPDRLEEGEVCLADQGVANTNATASGLFFGMALSTFSNIGLSMRGFPVAGSLAITSFGVALIHTGLALSSFGAAEELDELAADSQGADAIEAYASAAAHRTVGEAATATGSVFFGLAVASAFVAIAADTDALDLTVAAGPGTVSVSGTF